MSLVLFSGGAAHGLVSTVENEFNKTTGERIDGSYGAVGMYRDKYLAGDHADMLILSRVLIDGLVEAGEIAPVDVYDIGAVRTAVAVRNGDKQPDISDTKKLRAVLAVASDIYAPDLTLSSAGIHLANVLHACGIADNDPRVHPHPNGASAMKALAAQRGGNPIGSTQITEILLIDGVEPIGMLPGEFELSTIYTIGITRRCAKRNAAEALVELLTGDFAKDLRPNAGFGL